jgi:hypothetical protein
MTLKKTNKQKVRGTGKLNEVKITVMPNNYSTDVIETTYGPAYYWFENGNLIIETTRVVSQKVCYNQIVEDEFPF